MAITKYNKYIVICTSEVHNPWQIHTLIWFL